MVHVLRNVGWRNAVARGSDGASTAKVTGLLIRHHVIRSLLREVAASSPRCHWAEGIRAEWDHLPPIAMVRRAVSASDALGPWITASPSIKSLVLWRRKGASRAVHRFFICVVAHGLQVIRWWWWRRRRSEGVPLLSGNTVLARSVARSTPTMRSLWLGVVVCCCGGRVARVYVVVMRPVRLVRLRVALVGVLRLVLSVCNRRS